MQVENRILSRISIRDRLTFDGEAASAGHGGRQRLGAAHPAETARQAPFALRLPP